MELSAIAIWLAAGLAGALSVLPASQVNPGYFRSCLLVALGLLVVGVLASWGSATRTLQALLIAGALISYLGSAAWTLGRDVVGVALIRLDALVGLAALAALSRQSAADDFAPAFLNAIAGSALLGCSMAAMLLGHYYLTAPWMSLSPLRRLTIAIGVAAGLRIAVSALAGVGARGDDAFEWALFIVLRWIVGVGGPILLAVMVWQTLKYKATQAATGILYVVVICVLIGETAGIGWGRLHGVPF